MLDINIQPWLVPVGPLLAFAIISLTTLGIQLLKGHFQTPTNTIPATDHRYGGHHPDYAGMPVPYQADWFRVFAIIVGMSGVVAALFFAWDIVFTAINEVGVGHDGRFGEEVFANGVEWLRLGGDASTSFNMGVLADPLTLAMLFMVPLAVFAIFTYSIGYMANDPRQARFFAFISLFAGAMLTLVVADNILLMFVGWEVMGLCSYLLIGFWYEKESAYKAAIKAFTVTRVADVVMLLGIAYLFFATMQVVNPETGVLLFPGGTLSFRDILFNPVVLEQLAATPAIIFGGLGMSAAGLIGILLITGTVGKSAQFPLHVWLPDAMEGPTPVSAMIHAAAMVSAGVYAVIRMYPLYVGMSNPHHFEPSFSAPLLYMALIGSFTALFAATMGIVQRDVKAVLAYSTISQLGFMVAALGIGAYIAAAFHLITHAFFKALLFMASGSVIHAMEHGEHHVHEHQAHAHGYDAHHEHSHDAHHHEDGHHEHFDPQDMFNMGGLRKNIPVTFWTFLIGGFSLAGFPLITAGFWSKDEILADGWNGLLLHGSGVHGLVFFMLALAAFLTAFYTMRQLGLTFMGNHRTEEAEHAGLGGRFSVVSFFMQAPLVLLAIFAITAGYVGVPPDFPVFGPIFASGGNFFHDTVIEALPHLVIRGEEVFHVSAPPVRFVPVFTSFLVAGFGLYFGWLLYWRKPLAVGEEDPLVKMLGVPIYNTLLKRYYLDDLYDYVFVAPAKWFAQQVNILLDKGIIDGILHTIAYVFTWMGDFIKMLNAWLIDGVGDGLPRGIYSFGGWMRRAQTGRVQQYLLVVLVAALIIGAIFALSAANVTAQ